MECEKLSMKSWNDLGEDNRRKAKRSGKLILDWSKRFCETVVNNNDFEHFDNYIWPKIENANEDKLVEIDKKISDALDWLKTEGLPKEKVLLALSIGTRIEAEKIDFQYAEDGYSDVVFLLLIRMESLCHDILDYLDGHKYLKETLIRRFIIKKTKKQLHKA